MSLDLASLQNRLKEEDEQKASRGNNNSTEDWYPFWNMDFGETAKLRFLPDADPNAPHFVKEKWLHKLTVTVDGREQTRSVPCLENYGEKTCPICEKARAFYKDNDDDQGLKYWRKRSYIAQVWVIDSPFDVEGSRHKLISLNPRIYEGIKQAIQQGDVEVIPTDFEAGYDFRLNKTRSGQWADYSTSRFAPRQSALDSEIVEGLELYNLADKLPRKPNLDYVNAVLEAALTGEEFVWNSNSDDSGSESSDLAATTTSNGRGESTTTVSEQKESGDAKESKVSDVMAMIADRKKNAK